MRKGPRKRQDILNTAAVLFAEKGYLDTAIQDILDQLNTSKGSFYHHFKTKFEVLAALARDQAQEAFLRYEAGRPFEAAAALNALLRVASFLTPEHLPLLNNLIALGDDFEGVALLQTIQDAVLEAFLPAFTSVMLQLRQQEEAVFGNEYSLKVAFASFLSICALLFAALGRRDSRAEALPLLRAARRHLEAALGMRPGALIIIEAAEFERLKSRLHQG